ncbi:chromosome segregation protein Csm1/Pcs1-domain-containing protein [Chaetomium fimeti]|uniref:Chromosome segregation protein Csm1/Pcs1-domain-containing protein n=1 Tax=Chaetomium fimeti TaxID=1854472 RepID=A0AAE0HDT3_9PEZI|nr:chromosome segregation protein Csm1/Pcs1-domain-containing protein [Chaetomium fimeti]
MSKAKARAHLLQLVDSDSEDGIGGNSLKPAISKSTMPPKKGKAGRKAANRVTKPAAKTSTTGHRSSGRIAAAVDEVTTGQKSSNTKGAQAKGPGRGRKRAAAAEEEAEEGEEEDTVMTEAPAPKQKGARGRPKKVAVEVEPQPTGARRGRKPAAKIADPDTTTGEVSEIPETQQPDGTQSDIDDEHDDLADIPVSRTPERAKAGRGSAPVPSSVSKRPSHTLSPDKGDPALRRRLGEMTQKYESLEHKYRDLKEVAVREAERNFDKLKKQSEEKSKAADELIATLKAELSATKGSSKSIQQLKKQLEESEAKADGLQTKFTDLTTSLTESKSEIRSLNLKLAAARSAEAAANAAAKVPGSAMKGSTGASRLAAANASEATQAAQKKENLYGDLTGLIVRSVKREGGEDVFDCIQTGRNGTLHFKLAVEILPEEGEAHCHYTPQLDPNRDRALIAVLPGYLVDEISFPQSQAGKFYARVLKALSEAAEE